MQRKLRGEQERGEKNNLERTSQCWYLGVRPHSALCSVGTSCLPGLDLQACRKIHPTIPYPSGRVVTVGPDLPVDREGGLRDKVCICI